MTHTRGNQQRPLITTLNSFSWLPITAQTLLASEARRQKNWYTGRQTGNQTRRQAYRHTSVVSASWSIDPSSKWRTTCPPWTRCWPWSMLAREYEDRLPPAIQLILGLISSRLECSRWRIQNQVSSKTATVLGPWAK